MYYIELVQSGSRIMVNMDAVAFIEPSTTGASIHIGKHVLYVDNSYEEIQDILFRHQGGIINSIKLTK